MWLFDFLKTSYNFADNMKQIFNRLDIDVSKDKVLSGYNLLVVHDSIADVLNWRRNTPQGININILKDFKMYLWMCYSWEIEKIKEMDTNSQREFLINIFEQQKFTVSELTFNVMSYSAATKWLNNFFDEVEDMKIIKKVFWF